MKTLVIYFSQTGIPVKLPNAFKAVSWTSPANATSRR
jgi:hypothetical protein